MKVNVISESAFTVQGHGVHSAFVEVVHQLKDYTDVDVASNTGRPADLIHIHTIGPYSLWRLWRRRRAKVVVSAHVTPDSFVGSLVGARYWRPAAACYLRWFYNRADAVLAVSEEVEHELKRMGIKRPVYLVPNTVETKELRSTPEQHQRARKRLGLDESAFVVLGVGQVQPRKRIDSFVAVAQKLPEIQFVWVGGMPFQALAAEAGAMKQLMQNPPANLTFTDTIPRPEVVHWYQAASLFWLPSAQETFGIVIVEAAAAGLPVLLRDLPVYRRTFTSGYEAGDDASFVNQIKRFASDRPYYRHWQQAAAVIAERYNAPAGAQRLLEIYQKVLKADRSAARH